MPLREDFIKDYDMNAEYLLDGIEFHNFSQKPFHKDDGNLVKEVELAVVQIYRRRVQERYRRREIIKKYRLIEQYYQFGHTLKQRESLKRKRNSFYTEAVSEFLKLASFARFFSYEEFQNFFQLSLKERLLKKEIEELVVLRQRGVTDVEEIEESELLNSKLLRIDVDNSTLPELSLTVREILVDLLDEESDESEDLDSPEENREDDYPYETGFFIPVLQGYNLLSRKEKTLCTAMNLRPAYYIAYKAVLIFADVEKRKGNSIESFNLKPHGLNKEQCLEILNFMSENGWIRCDNLLGFDN
ncbi:Transcriptional adapter 2-beta, partial [Stegodyphus mimosarum]